ncbi:MAG TPA: hypothetical protein VF384_05830 [Planctomycetota bacterium]
MAALLPVAGPSSEVVVDGPFAPEEVPVQTLRCAAVGAGAVAVWSRAGTVRFSSLR